MRPLTDNEYQRMRTQTESRLSGMSEIGFKIKAKKSSGTVKEWIETGYIADFRVNNGGREKIGTMQWTDPEITDFQQATAVLPVRYLYDGAMTVQSNDPEAADFQGMGFNVRQITEVGLLSGAATIDPIVTKLVLMVYNNMAALVVKEFDIVTTPFLTADAFILNLVGRANAEYLSFRDEEYLPTPGRQGYGIYVNGELIYAAGGIKLTNGIGGQVRKNGKLTNSNYWR